MSVFANKIRRLREGKGFSTRMLAEEMQVVTHGQISRYENDIHEPTLTVLKAYAKVFNVTLDYLCDDSIE
jgi:transcriptional regulator with XRE-family HTH domain